MKREGLLQLTPLLLPFGLVFLWGIGYTLFGAFTVEGPDGGVRFTPAHFREVLTDPLLRSSVFHTLTVSLLAAGISVALGTLLALGLWVLPRRFKTFALMYKLPIILPQDRKSVV